MNPAMGAGALVVIVAVGNKCVEINLIGRSVRAYPMRTLEILTVHSSYSI